MPDKPVYAKETPDRGWGLFAARDFAAGEFITKFEGPRVHIESMEGIPQEVWDHLLNVGPVDYVMPREPEVRTNHSCDPNAGLIDEVSLAPDRSPPSVGVAAPASQSPEIRPGHTPDLLFAEPQKLHPRRADHRDAHQHPVAHEAHGQCHPEGTPPVERILRRRAHTALIHGGVNLS